MEEDAQIYENFEFQPNQLQFFYPKHLKDHLTKNGSQAGDPKLASDLKRPSGVSQISKNLKQMRALSECQFSLMNVVFKKISRRSKPIKKSLHRVDKQLKSSNIDLLADDFDLVEYINKICMEEENRDEPLEEPARDKYNC